LAAEKEELRWDKHTGIVRCGYRTKPPIKAKEAQISYSENTKMIAFVTFANLTTVFPIPAIIATLVPTKFDYLTVGMSWSEAVIALNAKRQEYTDEQFRRLLQLHGLMNIQPLKIHRGPIVIPKPELKGIDAAEIKGKDWLNKEVVTLRNQIRSFLERSLHASLLHHDYTATPLIGNNNGNDKTNNNAVTLSVHLNKVSAFYRFAVYFAGCVVPALILNEKNNTAAIKNLIAQSQPHYYRRKLAPSHISYLNAEVEKYYAVLGEFRITGNSAVPTEVLQAIQDFAGPSIQTQNQLGLEPVWHEYLWLKTISLYIPDTTAANKKHRNVGSLFNAHTDAVVYQTNQTMASFMRAIIITVDKCSELIRPDFAEYITTRVFSAKQTEKFGFMDQIKNMSKDEQRLNQTLKKYKLGMWDKGTGKGIQAYDQSRYEFDAQKAQYYEENQIAESEVNEDDLAADAGPIDNIFDPAAASAAARQPNKNGLGPEPSQEVPDDEGVQEDDWALLGEDYDDGDPFGDERED
jgi:hypothetical protein